MNKSMQNLNWMHMTFPSRWHHSITEKCPLVDTPRCRWRSVRLSSFCERNIVSNLTAKRWHWTDYWTKFTKHSMSVDLAEGFSVVEVKTTKSATAFFVLDVSLEVIESAMCSPFPSVVWGNRTHHRSRNSLRWIHFIIETEYSVKSHRMSTAVRNVVRAIPAFNGKHWFSTLRISSNAFGYHFRFCLN